MPFAKELPLYCLLELSHVLPVMLSLALVVLNDKVSVLGPGLEPRVLGPGLGLEHKVLGPGLEPRVLVNITVFYCLLLLQ